MPFKDPEKFREYNREKARKYRLANPEKARATVRAWRKRHPDRQRRACQNWRANNLDKLKALLERGKPRRALLSRARTYGIAPEEVIAIVARENCEICGIPGDCIDHDHVTGAVRGLLCDRCNHLLGHARENLDVLANAAVYLVKYAGSEKVLAKALVDAQIVHQALDKRPGGK